MGGFSSIRSDTPDPFSEIVVHHNSFKLPASPSKKLRRSAANSTRDVRPSWKPRRPSMIHQISLPSPSPPLPPQNRFSVSSKVIATINERRGRHSYGQEWSSATQSLLVANTSGGEETSLVKDLPRMGTSLEQTLEFSIRSSKESSCPLVVDGRNQRHYNVNKHESLVLPPPLTDSCRSSRSLPTGKIFDNMRGKVLEKNHNEHPNWMRRRIRAHIWQAEIKSRMLSSDSMRLTTF